MLDCDLKREEEVIEFAEEYAKFHDLGSALVMKTSDSTQVDLSFRKLENYSIIFGKVLSWEEIRWHVNEANRLGIVDRKFTALREFGYITIRANAKNEDIPHLEIVHRFENGDDTGVKDYLDFWDMCKELGR
jgi:hypothetical protein